MAAKDSTEALKAKKEELELKKNMAPYLSNANKVENLPSSEDLIKNLFGQQTSSLVQGFEKGWEYAATGGKGSESHRKFLETDFGKGVEYARTSGNPGKFVDGKYQEGTKDNWFKKLFSE